MDNSGKENQESSFGVAIQGTKAMAAVYIVALICLTVVCTVCMWRTM